MSTEKSGPVSLVPYRILERRSRVLLADRGARVVGVGMIVVGC
jgi:hypothetical protein